MTVTHTQILWYHRRDSAKGFQVSTDRLLYEYYKFKVYIVCGPARLWFVSTSVICGFCPCSSTHDKTCVQFESKIFATLKIRKMFLDCGPQFGGLFNLVKSPRLEEVIYCVN